MATMFSKAMLLKVEPELKDALADAARKERTSASELIRRELRAAVARRSRSAPSYEQAGA